LDDPSLSIVPRDLTPSSIMGSPTNASQDAPHPTNGTIPHDSKGWDGKLRVDRRAGVTNAEILSDPEYSDEEAPPVEQIDADEGWCISAFSGDLLTLRWGRLA